MQTDAHTLLTAEQFEALARLMRLHPGSARDAARLVMVSGWDVASAASHSGAYLVNAEQAVMSAWDALELARVAAGQCPTETPGA